MRILCIFLGVTAYAFCFYPWYLGESFFICLLLAGILFLLNFLVSVIALKWSKERIHAKVTGQSLYRPEHLLCGVIIILVVGLVGALEHLADKLTKIE